MINAVPLEQLADKVRRRTASDSKALDALVKDVQDLKAGITRIPSSQGREVYYIAIAAESVSVEFDPFRVAVIRVVDSAGAEKYADVVSPFMDTAELSHAQFRPGGEPATPLGAMMVDLGVRDLTALSPMIPPPEALRDPADRVNPSWIDTYRDLCEWGVIYALVKAGGFPGETVILHNGLLRSLLFRGDLFRRLCQAMAGYLEGQPEGRRAYLVGIAQKSAFLEHYRLALMVADVFPEGTPLYVRVPRRLENKAYRSQNYTRASHSSNDPASGTTGTLHFARFGSRRSDPVWPVDVFAPQVEDTPRIMGHLLVDAARGYPVQLYPLTIQRARSGARIDEVSKKIIRAAIFDGVRDMVPKGVRPYVDVAASDLRLARK